MHSNVRRHIGHRPWRAARGLAGLALCVAPLWLSGCAEDGSSFLHPHGIVAAAQRRWLLEVTGLMLIVVLPVMVLVPLFAWRYRRGNTKAVYRPDWSFSWPLEFVIWGVPVLIVAALSVVIVGGERHFDPYSPLPSKQAPLDIQVVALNWKWLFIYPHQNIATLGPLVIEQDRPVSFRLTSDATMQSFLIPALGSQIYVMAGMVTRLNLMADRPGTLMGENSLFNGAGFQDEKFQVHVLQPSAFAAWVERMRTSRRTLDDASYRTLSQFGTSWDTKTSFNVAPDGALAFSSVRPNLFNQILSKYHPAPMRSSAISQH